MMYRRVGIYIAALVAALAAALALGACSANKNTAANRKYQEFITRYNIYYNGDVHYKETLADMERAYEDDYSRRVFMHPVEASTVGRLQPLNREGAEGYTAALYQEETGPQERQAQRPRIQGVDEAR